VAPRIFDARIPLARHACAEEIARSVLYLACPDSSFVTGATLSVHGGMHIWPGDHRLTRRRQGRSRRGPWSPGPPPRYVVPGRAVAGTSR
jgi:hypothetical protein